MKSKLLIRNSSIAPSNFWREIVVLTETNAETAVCRQVWQMVYQRWRNLLPWSSGYYIANSSYTLIALYGAKSQKTVASLSLHKRFSCSHSFLCKNWIIFCYEIFHEDAILLRSMGLAYLYKKKLIWNIYWYKYDVEELKVFDDGTLIQLLSLGHYPTSCFYLKHTTFRRADSISAFRWNLLSWAQSIELIPISGHQHQHKAEYINQTQHNLSTEVKTNITELHTHDGHA
jgi:hypothetical protein